MKVRVENTRSKITDATRDERAWLDAYLSFVEIVFRKGRFGTSRIESRVSLLDKRSDTFPSGMVTMVTKQAAEDGVSISVEDSRIPICTWELGADLEWLYNYQFKACEAVVEHGGRGILHLSTGAGKTDIFCGLCKALPCHWLFVVHRADLMHQAAARWIKHGGHEPGIVGDSTFRPDPQRRLTVATFQTLSRGMAKKEDRVLELLRDVEALCVDECFPRGTLIDGKPIEEIVAGDTVSSFEEETSAIVSRRVVRKFKSAPRELVRVHFDDGDSIVCTSGHPFLSRSGWWVEAACLGGHHVLSRQSVEKDCQKVLRAVRGDLDPGWATRSRAGETGAHVLRRSLSQFGDEQAIARNSATSRGEASTTNARIESDAFGRNTRESEPNTTNDETQTPDSGWERTRPDGAARNVAQCVDGHGRRLDTGTRRQNEESAKFAELGGDRHSSSGNENGDRDRRQQPLRAKSEGTRSTEGSVFSWRKVDRVEILEPGGDGTFGGLCPDGFVYNLEVEGTHTYFANDFVVHNCHVTPAAEFNKVVMQTRRAFYRVGLSGTPLDRGDKKAIYAIGALGPVIYRVAPEELIRLGILARPRIRAVKLKQEHPAKGWQSAYKHLVTESHVRNVLIIEMAKRAEKPMFVFVKEIGHGKMLTKALNLSGIRTEFVWGEKATGVRSQAIKDLRYGNLDAIVCSVIFQEGIDVPELRAVINAAGMKSTIAALQRIGRGMRSDGGKKTEFEVWEIKDEGNKFLVAHSRNRLKAYRKEGHAIEIIVPSQLASLK